ncbi:IFI44 protein, partial [Polypterus senegalus]
MAGHGLVSVSKQYRTYPVEDGRCGKKLPFILCDTMGLEGNSDKEEGIHVDDVISVIRGHVSDLYELALKSSICLKNDLRYEEVGEGTAEVVGMRMAPIRMRHKVILLATAES